MTKEQPDTMRKAASADRDPRRPERTAGGGSPAWGDPLAERVRALAEPLCEARGVELVHAECLRGPGGRLLRITLDRPEGITLDDCTAVSRELGDLLDVTLPELPAYRLEVSSPGPERRLSRPGDFERFRGRRARLQLRRPLDGRRTFSGVLAGLDAGGDVCLEVEGQIRRFSFEAIAKAHLVAAEPSAPGGGALRTHRGDAPC